ncbi:histidinol-phosphatase [Parastagonospora nodorum]|uniref:Histidinol-phosphatase n=1 Tax=Phaeosphaeria nodorum (strain SN15 / ATCC MYA-4574 / FGSC 10173) TaxID=321614 RepID=A0A7U2IBT3_PHANO|nr:histidinol-phosphatase [Parastagonospora nodorum]QRD06918.1 histidinol-phosphatase [Parastagonospora nodorum SN15]KAH3923373.1 histidinol-phosphatase [Parastagonospora nodorum]KAH3951877.1 histidinol-phosphatase [Parastagonospora nodorum]KAH3981819.1 histidinol-phosphatase [Parastagonospora nodorum]
MPYSHHSHSGQFCGHAKDTLEEVVQAAIAKGFHSFALTEHIPRPYEDFYPEEINSHTEESLVKLFDDFYAEAQRLRVVYAGKIQILIGFESEYIRPSTLQIVQGLLDKYTFDFFMGSLHHTHTIPIDFDRAMYEQARAKAGGTDEKLFEDYFDSQYEMLRALQPPVIGHFDLIRLLSDHRDADFKNMNRVWDKVRRNLDFVASYGGRLELNSSGLRKGLAEPYPCLPICQMFLQMGGSFVMSDDSHGIEQIGTNYSRLLAFIQKAGIKEIHYIDPRGARNDARFPSAGFTSIATSKLAASPFWEDKQ